MNAAVSAPLTAVSPLVTARRKRDRIILQNLKLVHFIAERMNIPVHVEREDLVHAGVLGLLEAAMKYDDNKHVTFQSYAKHRIRGAILDSLRDNDWASRRLRRRYKRFEEVTREFACMERHPTEHELADKMGVDIERWRRMRVELQAVSLSACSALSGSASESGNDNRNVLESLLATTELNPDVLTGRRELRAVLSRALKPLPRQYQTVIRCYYTQGQTLREIGQSLRITESRVCQIHHAALRCMAESLQAAGIHSGRSVL
ncbi:MAG: sigma-70 family RNA polymerase sigma factor [Acidobacteriota bacterium]